MYLISKHTGYKSDTTGRRPRWPMMAEWSTRRKWRTPSKRIWQRMLRRPPKRRISVDTTRHMPDMPRTEVTTITEQRITARITDHRHRSVMTDEWWIHRKWHMLRPRIWPHTPRSFPKPLICRTWILIRTPNGESLSSSRSSHVAENRINFIHTAALKKIEEEGRDGGGSFGRSR